VLPEAAVSISNARAFSLLTVHVMGVNDIELELLSLDLMRYTWPSILSTTLRIPWALPLPPEVQSVVDHFHALLTLDLANVAREALSFGLRTQRKYLLLI